MSESKPYFCIRCSTVALSSQGMCDQCSLVWGAVERVTADPHELLRQFRARRNNAEKNAQNGRSLEYGDDYCRQELRIANVWTMAAKEVERMPMH